LRRDPQRGRRDRSRRPRRRPARGYRAGARGDRLGRGGRTARRTRGVLAVMRFAESLSRPGFGAIAEFKRRSPSAGDISPAAHHPGLDTLVEAHGADELGRATRLDAGVIGVNARDLGTFRIDRGAQLELVAKAPRDRLVIAESAIHTRAQAAAAELAGADAVLIGTSLMRAHEPGAKLRELLSRPLVKVCGLTRQ